MKVREFLKVNSLKQVEIARYLGVTEAAISNVVKGKSEFSDENLIKILNNPYGWDVSMLKESDQPENAVEENPQDGMVNTLLTLIAEKDKNIRTLIEMIKAKDAKIDELQEELRSYREKGETARTAADSSSVSAV